MFTPDRIVKSGLSGSSRGLHAQKAMWALASRLNSSRATCPLHCLKWCTQPLRVSFVSSLKHSFNSHGLRTAVMLYMKPLIEFLAWNKHSRVIIMIIVMILRLLGLSLPHSSLPALLAHWRTASNCLGNIFISFLSTILTNEFSFHLVGQYSRVLTPAQAYWNTF